jgi:hypothetical protein
MNVEVAPDLTTAEYWEICIPVGTIANENK